MKTVSTWRCQCGISIKLVGETIRTKPVTPQIAKCPRCSFEQGVYVDVILSISDDTANTITQQRQPPSGSIVKVEPVVPDDGG